MPRKGQHRGRQDWLDYSDDDEDDAPGPSSAGRLGGGGASEGSSKHGRRRVHGVDRAHHARLHADVGVDRGALQGSPRARAFAIADGTGRGGVVVGARAPSTTRTTRGSSRSTTSRCRPRSSRCSAPPCPSTPSRTRTCSAAGRCLAPWTPCSPSRSTTTTNRAPHRPQSHTGVDLWDTLPSEVRLLILDRLGPKDAARAASTCRDFAENVRAWRLNARGLHLPPDLSVAGLASLAGAYSPFT